MGRRERVLMAVAGLALVVGALSVASAAGAVPIPETGRAGLLRLDADPYPAHDVAIARGDRVYWMVTAELDADEPGDLSVQVRSAEPLAERADALRFRFASCGVPWDVPTDSADPAVCAVDESVVIADAAFATTDESRSWSLGRILPGEPRYFLVTLSLPLSTPGSVADDDAEVAFGFVARAGDRPVLLAASGAILTGPLLLAGGLLLGGLVLAASRRREFE